MKRKRPRRPPRTFEELLDLPELPKLREEVAASVGPLALSAVRYRNVVIRLVKHGTPWQEILDTESPQLTLANKVIDSWCEHLGVPKHRGGHDTDLLQRVTS